MLAVFTCLLFISTNTFYSEQRKKEQMKACPNIVASVVIVLK